MTSGQQVDAKAEDDIKAIKARVKYSFILRRGYRASVWRMYTPIWLRIRIPTRIHVISLR